MYQHSSGYRDQVIRCGGEGERSGSGWAIASDINNTMWHNILMKYSICQAMFRFVPILLFLNLGGSPVHATKCFNPIIDTWKVFEFPDSKDQAMERNLRIKANYPPLDWEVYKEDGKIKAGLKSIDFGPQGEKPPFLKKLQQKGDTLYHKASPGWIVSFNRGEFGADFDWYSVDGGAKLPLFSHNVNEIQEYDGEIYAVSGLDHLLNGAGSLIALEKDPKVGYVAKIIAQIPSAAMAMRRLSNGTFILLSGDGLFTVDRLNNTQQIMAQEDWSFLYPNSIEISGDESKVYIGMRQYVVEYDLKERNARYLAPVNTTQQCP